uniref:Protein kinase domain-containing protein n=1 Tax=Mola mola TaxID=94237 RepID=A0A3Q4BU54_MOLML
MGHARLLVPGENIRMLFSAPEYCAPEIHHHDLVTTATDMWSVGVMAYALLSGLNPFAAESTTKMIENISNCEYVFDSEAFKDISLEAMDFVDRLLVKDRKLRMTAHEALEHPWLKMKIEHVSKKVIKTLRHRRYYQTLVKKTDTIVSSARIAYGGTFKNQRGLAVGKVKIGTEYHGLRTGPVMHGSAEEVRPVLVCRGRAVSWRSAVCLCVSLGFFFSSPASQAGRQQTDVPQPKPTAAAAEKDDPPSWSRVSLSTLV